MFYHEDFDRIPDQIMADMPDLKIYEFKKSERLKLQDDCHSAIRMFKYSVVLNKEQEFHLFRQYAYLRCKNLPSEKIRNQLIESSLKLILFTYFRQCGSSIKVYLNLDDAISLGSEKLCEMVDEFDWRKGTKFSTFFVLSLKRDFIYYYKRRRLNCLDENSFDGLHQVGFEIEQNDIFDQSLILKQNLKTLDPKIRQCLHLKFFEGMTDVDVAKKMKISTQHFTKFFKTGLKLLHEKLVCKEKQNVLS